MSYTRPSASAADATFQGASAYTRPSATAADASFAAGAAPLVESLGVITRFGTPVAIFGHIGSVSGFAPVQFGTPTCRLTQPVSGFAPVQFGTPIGYQFYRVQGFAPVQFGTPFLYPMHVAPWPVSTQFGTPSARKYWNAQSLGVITNFGAPEGRILYRAQGFAPVQFGTPFLHPSHVAPWPVSTQFGGVGGNQFWKVPTLGVITKFGTPTTPTNRTGEVSGFAPVRFGKPLAIRHRPPNTDIICRVEGFNQVRFGTPSARWSQSGQATSIAPTVQFGAPRAFTTHHVEGMAPSVQFGAPATRTTHRVSGFKPVAFGLAGAILTQHATGTAPKARFGTPKTIRSNWYEVRGFCPFRAGTPRGYQRNNRRADGFSPVQFGMAAAFHAHRTTSVPPVARLGKPLLKRNTQC